MEKKILVLTSCSYKKKKGKMKAIDLYQGDFFKLVKKFAFLNNFDIQIISAKYGLLTPNSIIENYDKKLKDKEDIIRLRNLVEPRLRILIKKKNYDKILVFMGEDYKKVIEPLLKTENVKFIIFFDKRGLGGYLSLMKTLLKLNKGKLLKLIFNQDNKIITINTIEKYLNNYKILN
ncbi:MAG: DUF6884 domain-containing protein [Promethearchaeota archaeon]